MKWVEIATLVVSVLSLIGIYYAKAGVDLLREESRERNEWAGKHVQAYDLIVRMRGNRVVNGVELNPYVTAFGPQLMQLIRTYLEEQRPGEVAHLRVLAAEQYDLQPIRDAIQAVLDAVERFKVEFPDHARFMRL
jgi:hypothetical protein